MFSNIHENTPHTNEHILIDVFHTSIELELPPADGNHHKISITKRHPHTNRLLSLLGINRPLLSFSVALRPDVPQPDAKLFITYGKGLSAYLYVYMPECE